MGQEGIIMGHIMQHIMVIMDIQSRHNIMPHTPKLHIQNILFKDCL